MPRHLETLSVGDVPVASEPTAPERHAKVDTLPPPTGPELASIIAEDIKAEEPAEVVAEKATVTRAKR